MMEEQLLKLAASQGVWAVLSIVLIFYILKKQEKRDCIQQEREKNYQIIIKKLTDKFSIMQSIQKDIKDISIKIGK